MKDGRIVDSLGVSPVMHNFRIMHMDRALCGGISAFVVGLGPNGETLAFGHLDFSPDVLCYPGCHVHAQSIRARTNRGVIGPVDSSITSQFIHDLTIGLRDKDYPTSNLPCDLKVAFQVLATFARKLGLSELDNDLSFMGDKFSQEFKDCLENA